MISKSHQRIKPPFTLSRAGDLPDRRGVTVRHVLQPAGLISQSLHAACSLLDVHVRPMQGSKRARSFCFCDDHSTAARSAMCWGRALTCNLLADWRRTLETVHVYSVVTIKSFIAGTHRLEYTKLSNKGKQLTREHNTSGVSDINCLRARARPLPSAHFCVRRQRRRSTSTWPNVLNLVGS
ncbi:hypothetical protein KC352_g49 [Hortaea werneckii]|nr:hypothetical protein KC352_g49 [Hortaea werneckii]